MHLDTPLSQAIRTKRDYLKQLQELGLLTILDLLLYFPRAHEDLSLFKSIRELKEGETVTLKGFLKGIQNQRTKTGKTITKAFFFDDVGATIECVWFNQPHLKRILPEDTEVIASSKIQFSYGKLVLQNPEIETKKDFQLHTGGLVPVYPQHDLITSKWLRGKIYPLLPLADELPELLPEEILQEEGLIAKASAVREIHFPTTQEALKKARDRLEYEELFLLQLQAVKAKQEWQQQGLNQAGKRSIPMDINLVKQFFASLPFSPTGAQKVAIYEILKDMEKPYPMMRLLEGDVGSGKTLVAFMAILHAVLHGFQAVLMAPTEVLARQHYGTLKTMLERFLANPHPEGAIGQSRLLDRQDEDLSAAADRLQLGFLTGSLKAAEKKEIHEKLQDGSLKLVIGTHALIQDEVSFQRLGLAVIDEQHRFGVKQREMLMKHGAPHVLTMTATPIPRTLAIVAYGDQDLSVLNEMPPGRQTIVTKVVPPEHRITVNRFVADKVRRGQQVYVICPLIDDSDMLEVKSVKAEYERLKTEIFPEFQVSMLHGRMKAEEKEAIMQAFASGTTDILVSTSVIEVGIDVPNATIILIEGAERFGLSQLHQFRGRVGRGKDQSYCFLYTNSSSGDTYTRLQAMVKYSDGFKLAEIDLKLRGPGEVYGIRQSGLPDLKLASLMNGVLVSRVRKAAEALIERDTLKNYPLLLKALEALRQKSNKQ